jgi:hypothetical protein
MAKPVPVSLGTSLASFFFFFSIGFPRSIVRGSFVTSVLHLPPAAVYTPGSSSPHNRSFVVRFHSDDGRQYRIPCSSSSSSPSCHPSSPRRSFVVRFHSDRGQYLPPSLSLVCALISLFCAREILQFWFFLKISTGSFCDGFWICEANSLPWSYIWGASVSEKNY